MTWKIQIQDRIKLIQMSDQGPNALDFDYLNRLKREFEPDDSFAEKFVEQWFTPETQAKLDEAVRKLKKN